jgi:Chitin synthase/UDP-glucose/GDP-mannose dehydrogenase family, NAD binding domain
MIIPVLYYFCLALWIPQTFREKLQYLMGLLLYIVCGPFLNIFVLLYALWNMDSFGWGKTRRVVSDANNEKVVAGTADDEAEIGMRPSARKALKHDTVAVLGFGEAYATLLAKSFGKHYRTIAYDPSDEVLARVRAQFSGAENYSIETTSDQEQLTRANIFLIAAPPQILGERVSSSVSQAPLHLRDAAELVRRHAKPGNIVMIESTVPVGTTRSLIGDLEDRGVFCGYAPAASPNSLKRISALSEHSLSQIMTTYRHVFAQIATAVNPEAAEMYHLLEIAHRQSQVMLTNELEGPQNGERLQDNLRRISGMWKEFAEAAEQGVERTETPSEKAVD